MKNEKVKVINNLIEQSQKKYSKYRNYLDAEFYQSVYDALSNEESISYASMMIINKMVLKRLCDFVRDGDIDLEIDLLSDYDMITTTIMQKKKIEITQEIKESILINALETYQGDNIFSIHILDCIKRMNDPSKKHTIKEQVEEKEDTPIIIDINKEKNIIKENNNSEISDSEVIENVSFIDIVNNYIDENDLTSSNPNYIEDTFRKLSIFIGLDSDDILFKKFIYLRYGYHHDIYFQLDDISKILNISRDEVLEYYSKSMDLMKEALDIALNNVFKYDVKKYIKT